MEDDPITWRQLAEHIAKLSDKDLDLNAQVLDANLGEMVNIKMFSGAKENQLDFDWCNYPHMTLDT